MIREKKKGNEFKEEELNPNRPHNYREKYGKSPIGNIREVMATKTEEELAAIKKRQIENHKKTLELKRRTKEILEAAIKLSEEEQQIFLEDLKSKEDIAVADAILYAQISKAIKTGDTQSAIFIRDTSGQKPKDESEVSVSVDQLLKNSGALEEEDDIDED